MPSLVLDSSVTMTWFLNDEVTDATAAVFNRVMADGALVPSLWRIETGNALLVAERRGRINAAARIRAMADLRRLQIEMDQETTDRAWDATYSLAQRFQLTLYDACYLELAQRSGLALASLDEDLRSAALVLGTELLGAPA